MKKFSILFAAAVAALATFSCAKEENVRDDKPEVPAIHFTVVAEQTKTVVDASEDWANWEADDQLKIVETLVYNTASASGVSGYQTGSAVAAAAGKSVEFDATIPASLPEGATAVTSASYIAAYPKELNLEQGGENKFWRVNLPAEQWPGNGTFDKAADVLISAPIAKTERVATGDKLNFRFHRIGTAVKMTVKGLTNGEKLKKIEVTAPINIVGYVKVDIATGDYLEGPVSYSNGGKTLTLKFNDLAINGDVDVWFRVLPGEWESIAIMAETDVAYYYRDAAHESAITLSENLKFVDTGRTRFAVNMGAKRVEKGNTTDFTKVTAQNQIGEGAKYIVAYVNENKGDVMLPFEGSLKYLKSKADVDVASDVIAVDESEVQVVTLEAAGGENEFYVLFGGKYLSCTANNATLTLNDDKLTTGADIWTVTPAGIVNKEIKNGSNVAFEIRYNTGANPKRFANYAGSQQAITLFVNGTATVDTRTSVSLSFTDGSAAVSEVNLDPSNYAAFQGLDVVANPDVADVKNHIWWDYVDNDGVIDDLVDGEVELSGTAGTAVITAHFDGDANYRPAEASYTINVSATVPVPTEWVETALANITSSDVFVIVGNDAYALPHNNGTSSAPGVVAVTVSSGKLTGSISDDIKWKVSGNSTDGYTFYPSGDATKWLYCNTDAASGSNNNARVGTGDRKVFALNGSSIITKDDYVVRYLNVYNTQDWRFYVSDNGTTIKFYKETQDTDTRTAVTLSYAQASIEKTTDNYSEFTGQTLTGAPAAISGNITYSMSGDAIGTVNASSGVVSLNGTAGTATVTATFAGDATYKPASASYTITVTAATPVGNDGSLEHPYTASEARDLALAGNTDTYYITGTVTKIANQFDVSHGTANFWIDENGTAQNIFEGYHISYFGNQLWTEGDAVVLVGDEVVINGSLTVFNTSVAETSSGYLVSVNGKTKGLKAGSMTVTTNDSNKQITVAWGAATGSTQPINYVVSCGTQEYNATAAGSHTFTMADYGHYDVSVVADASDALRAVTNSNVSLIEPGTVSNDGSEAHPYTASEAAAAASGTAVANTYVKGIVSAITTAFNSQFNNISFTISDDGQTAGTQFTAYRTSVSSADDVAVGDAVVLKGSLKMYNTTPELDAGNTIVKSLRRPSFTGGSTPFETSTSVTLSAETGATIYYTLDESTPTEASAVYSSAIALSATTTVKAIAVKDGLVTGVASKKFTKSNGGTTTPDPETIVFADLGLSNGVQYSDPFNGGNFTITFAGGGNDGKYYTTGSGIRTYGGGTITVESTHTISEIQFTWDGSNAPTDDVANPSGYSTSTKKWTGSANSIVLSRPSGTGHWRLQSVTVTYK